MGSSDITPDHNETVSSLKLIDARIRLIRKTPPTLQSLLVRAPCVLLLCNLSLYNSTLLNSSILHGLSNYGISCGSINIPIMTTALSPSRTPPQPGIHKTTVGDGPPSPPHPLGTGGSSTQNLQEILLQDVLRTFSAVELASMRQVWGKTLTLYTNEEGHGSVDDALRAITGEYSTDLLIALKKVRDGEQITDDELAAAGMSPYNYQERRYEDARSNGVGNYLVRWTIASKECDSFIRLHEDVDGREFQAGKGAA